jgi:hypothetical protein
MTPFPHISAHITEPKGILRITPYIFETVDGLTRKQKGKISLTQKCENFLNHKTLYDFYRYLFMEYTTRFNWKFSDLYPDSWIVLGGFGFSILLVQKYGGVWRDLNFYSSKYIQAFPSLTIDFPDSEMTSGNDMFRNCYEVRVFHRFLKRFGLVEIEGNLFKGKNLRVKKTELVGRLIKWK